MVLVLASTCWAILSSSGAHSPPLYIPADILLSTDASEPVALSLVADQIALRISLMAPSLGGVRHFVPYRYIINIILLTDAT